MVVGCGGAGPTTVWHRGCEKGWGFALGKDKNIWKTVLPGWELFSHFFSSSSFPREGKLHFFCSKAGGMVCSHQTSPFKHCFPLLFHQQLLHRLCSSHIPRFFISHLLTPLLLSRALLKSMTAIHIPFHCTSAVVCSLDIFSDACLKAALKP